MVRVEDPKELSGAFLDGHVRRGRLCRGLEVLHLCLVIQLVYPEVGSWAHVLDRASGVCRCRTVFLDVFNLIVSPEGALRSVPGGNAPALEVLEGFPQGYKGVKLGLP